MKKQKNIIMYTAIAAVFFLAACSPQKVAENYLSPSWGYAVGKAGDTVDEAAQYAFNPISDFSSLQSLVPGGEGYIWIRNDFKVPDGKQSEHLGLLLGRIAIADETWVNGSLVGSTGRPGKDFFSAWNIIRFYSIPSGVIHQGGVNSLMTKIYVNGEGFIFSDRIIAPYDDLVPVHAIDRFINSLLNGIITIIIFSIGLMYLLVFLKRRQDRENLYYSLICLGAGVYLFNFFISEFTSVMRSGMSYLLFQKVVLVMPFFIAFFMVLFVHRFLARPVSRPVLAFFIAVMVAPVAMVFAQRDYASFLNIKMYAFSFGLFPVLYMFGIMIYSAVKRRPGTMHLMLGFSPIFICILYDIIVMNVIKTKGNIYLGGYSFPAVLIAMGGILTGRFVNDRNRAEELNVNLERKVDDRTVELRRANDEIAAAMVELEAVNENLTSVNRQLEQTHRIMKRDMQMAVNVQSSFFPRKPPLAEGWDVGLVFRPMSGVSGDCYDFYVTDGALSGVSLCDVSGHGIASGLITMIAKSVFFRNFNRLSSRKTGSVLEEINRELILELGSVDNYLTGILLRISGNRIEYANAGHTDMILRRTSDGSVFPVNADPDVKGNFLGVAAMEGKYQTLSFTMRKDDAVLLYSDCLIETKNRGGEQFGVDRLNAVFAALPKDQSAQQQVSMLAAALYGFAGSEELNDDLSIILVRRTQ